MKRKIIAGMLAVFTLLLAACASTSIAEQRADEYVFRGNRYLDAGDYDSAIAEYDEALIIYPGYWYATRKRQEALDAKQQQAQAQRQAQDQQQAQRAQDQQAQAQRQQEQQEAEARQQAQVPRELSFGTRVEGNLRTGGEDWYSVLVTGEGSLTVETSGRTDTYLEAYDGSRNLIAKDDDSGQGYNAKLQINARPGQTYSFRVRGAERSDSGPYGITASFEDLAQQTPSENDFEIVQNRQGKITITGYTGTAKNIIIPSRISGIEVVAITDSAFMNKGLIQVVIPDTVVLIGDRAFAGNNLTEVTLPRSLQSIGSYAFMKNKLETLAIPPGVAEIGLAAFSENRLYQIRIPENVKSISAQAFYNNRLAVIELPAVFRAVRVSAGFGFQSEIFEKNPMELINICANWDENELNAMSLDTNFINYYLSQGKKAGIYHKNGRIWTTVTQAEFSNLAEKKIAEERARPEPGPPPIPGLDSK